MATTLFDVNALIYWTFTTSPWHEEVAGALKAIVECGDDAIVCASSLNEAYYTLMHHCGFTESEARQALNNIVSVFGIAPTTSEVVKRAISSDEPDYEDAVVRACAEINQVDEILCYDRAAFRSSEIPKVTASYFLQD